MSSTTTPTTASDGDGESGLSFVIDFEAFQHGAEDYIIKELCILNIENPLQVVHAVFRPPMSWRHLSPEQRRTYGYQKGQLHQLSWDEGQRAFCVDCILRNLCYKFPLLNASTAKFYVVGEQKCAHLKQLFPKLNIMNYYNLSYKHLPPQACTHLQCPYRNHDREHCALLKCYRVYMHHSTYHTI